MASQEEIQPPFDTTLPGYECVGRGPTLQGSWSRDRRIAYRSARCGTVMPAYQSDYFECACGAMYVDRDYHRFGSSLGDRNILVYRKSDPAE